MYVHWLFLLGQTPLHLAASNSYAKDTLQLLLLHPDIRADVTNGTGERPIDLAQRCGRYGYLFEIAETCINILWSCLYLLLCANIYVYCGIIYYHATVINILFGNIMLL